MCPLLIEWYWISASCTVQCMDTSYMSQNLNYMWFACIHLKCVPLIRLQPRGGSGHRGMPLPNCSADKVCGYHYSWQSVCQSQVCDMWMHLKHCKRQRLVWVELLSRDHPCNYIYLQEDIAYPSEKLQNELNSLDALAGLSSLLSVSDQEEGVLDVALQAVSVLLQQGEPASLGTCTVMYVGVNMQIVYRS